MTRTPVSETPAAGATGQHGSLGEQLVDIIERLPPDALSLQELLDVFSDEGLLLLTILLTLIFLIPVSIPGVSTVFGTSAHRAASVGSVSNTSSAAPPSRPEFSASIRASSSTT